MTFGDGVKAAALLFVAAVAQVSIFSELHVIGAVPDVLLVSLVALSLLRAALPAPPSASLPGYSSTRPRSARWASPRSC